MNDVDLILEKMFIFFNVNSAIELSDKIKVSQQAISSWRSRNAVNPIKKKCRELGIYNEIFGDINSNTQTVANNSGNNALNNYGEQNQKDNNLSLNFFDEDVLHILKTASTVVKSENKESFKKHLKSWIVDNI